MQATEEAVFSLSKTRSGAEYSPYTKRVISVPCTARSLIQAAASDYFNAELQEFDQTFDSEPDVGTHADGSGDQTPLITTTSFQVGPASVSEIGRASFSDVDICAKDALPSVDFGSRNSKDQALYDKHRLSAEKHWGDLVDPILGKNGFTGGPGREGGAPSLQSLLGAGYKYVAYTEGVNAHFVTSDGVCVAYFIAPATAGTIPSYMNELDSQLRGLEARRGGYFKAAEYDEHRRGKFKFRTFGISYGGGQKAPGVLKIHDKGGHFNRILQGDAFRNTAKFIDGIVYSCTPVLYKHYADVLGPLYLQYGGKPPIDGCIMPAVTINLGPKTICKAHRDWKNLLYGFCWVLALGDYDYKCGGHIVLHELRQIIEFPPRAIVGLPSAIVTHQNTPILDNETRRSVTFYAAGGLFRWSEYGGMSLKDFKASKGSGYQQADNDRMSRWAEGWNMFTKDGQWHS